MPPNNEKLFNRAKSRAKKSDEIENYIEISSESEFENEPEEEQCDSNIYTCERIIKMKYNKNTKRNEYLLKWLGYPSSANTWEPFENILDKTLLAQFELKQKQLKKTFRQKVILKKSKKEKVINNTKQENINELNKKEAKLIDKEAEHNKKINREVFAKKLAVHPHEQKDKAIKIDKKKEIFCVVAKQKTNNWSNYLKKINPNDIIQRIELDLDTPRYKAGLEPKIVNQQVDTLTGETLFKLKWKCSTNIDIMSAGFVALKFGQVLENWKKLNELTQLSNAANSL